MDATTTYREALTEAKEMAKDAPQTAAYFEAFIGATKIYRQSNRAKDRG